jgi:PEP-CTERM motif
MRILQIWFENRVAAVPVIAVLVLWTFVASPANATNLTINFETLPVLPTQPNNFFAAGAMQTYSSAGLFTISGGVALGNPTFLPAFPAHGSAPNLYGTTDFADATLLSAITLDLAVAQMFTNVTGVLFNGQSFAEDYTVRAFSGASQVALQTLLAVPDNLTVAGFANFSVSSTAANPITRVVFTTPNAGPNGWDFFVDTINVFSVPEPSSVVLVLAGLAALGYRARKR